MSAEAILIIVVLIVFFFIVITRFMEYSRRTAQALEEYNRRSAEALEELGRATQLMLDYLKGRSDGSRTPEPTPPPVVPRNTLR